MQSQYMVLMDHINMRSDRQVAKKKKLVSVKVSNTIMLIFVLVTILYLLYFSLTHRRAHA